MKTLKFAIGQLMIPALSTVLTGLYGSTVFAQSTNNTLETLETTVVTGSQIAEALRDTPVRTEVIDGSYLQQTATRSLAEAVEYSPGVRIDTACGNCNQQSIQMLGLPQQYIGLLFDGMPNFSTLASVYGIEQIPAGTIGQIEIVKGGGSVLYGPGAVAGVINLVPREPEVTGGRVEARIQGSGGDSFGTAPGGNLFGLYDYVSDDESFKATLYGGFDRIQPIDLNGDGFTDVSMRNLGTAGFRTLWRPVEDHTLSLDLSFADEERRGGDTGAAFSAPPNEAQIAEEIFSQRLSSTAKWEAHWNDQWNSRFAYSYSRTKRDSYYGGTTALADPSLGFGNTSDRLHYFDALAGYKLNDRHRFTIGSNYRTENLKDNQRSVNRVLDETYTNLGFYAQHRYQPLDAWTFEYGLRGDKHSEIKDIIVSPRAAALWSPNDDVRVRGAVATGFRAPETFDEDLHIESVGGDLRTTFNDPNLKEESSVTISLSPEWQVDENWRLELNTFHTWLKDTFVVEPLDDPSTPDVIEEVRTNGEGSRVYGAEFNAGYFAEFWSLEFSWVQQRLEYDNPQLVLGEVGGDPADNPIYSSTYVRTPESLGLIRFNHEGEWVDTFITGKITGPMDVPRVVSNPSNGDLVGNRLERSPWFFNIDLGVSRDFEVNGGELTTTLGVKNIFDDYQSDLETGQFRDASYIYGPAFPRTFFASVNYKF